MFDNCIRCGASGVPINKRSGACVDCDPLPVALPAGVYGLGSLRSPFPFSPEEAREKGLSRFASPVPLPCGHGAGSSVYLSDGESCFRCINEGAADAEIDPSAILWSEPGREIYRHNMACPDGPHVRVTHGARTEPCLLCPPPRKVDPARAAARERGETYYTPSAPCPKCGQRAEKHVQTGRCYGCHPRKVKGDPRRAAARKAGATRYTPSEPCPECGTYAERHTHTNRCYGCEPATDGRRDETIAALLSGAPEMIISREDAIRAGLPAFRTGEPCKHGHRSWRYVSTRNCIECHRTRA